MMALASASQESRRPLMDLGALGRIGVSARGLVEWGLLSRPVTATSPPPKREESTAWAKEGGTEPVICG